MRPNFVLTAKRRGSRLAPKHLLSLAILMASACTGLSQGTPAAAMSQPAQASSGLVVSGGDLITVTVFNTPELSGSFRVSPNGIVSLPQGGDVNVGGMSASQAGEAIERHLRETQIMLDPRVTVFVQEYSSEGVIVLGEVRVPGTYTLLGEHSLYGALAAAGGATVNQGQTIVISHPGDPARKETIDVTSQNYSDLIRSTRVEPGDTVFVSRGHMIYVYGDVTHPGAFSMGTGSLNVLQAIALAEGTDRIAASNKLSIIRETPGGIQSIRLDLKKIQNGVSPNPVLQAADILVVPRSFGKALFFQALPGATGAAVGSAVSAAIIR